MKGICSGAAALIAATTMVLLGGCAADQPQVAQAKEADKANPCLGVAPATGSMVRRKEDCGASRTQDEFEKQQTIDAIRARGGLGGTTSKPGG
jgi:hypothetical protein